MMQKIPAKEIEVCDICGRGGYLMTCKACRGRYCLMCDATITGCIHALDVCRTCGDRPEVITIAEKYAPKITAILKIRDAELSQLKIK